MSTKLITPGQKLACASVLAVSFAFLAALVSAIFARGPWYDEFFTFYVAQPRFDWIEALRWHWLTDNHPPLFYGLVRATSWLGDSVEPRRLVNLIVCLAGMVTLALLARRAPAWRVTLAIYAIGLLASPDAVFFGAELRSNFLAYVSSILATAALATIEAPGTPEPSRRARMLLCAILLVAFNTHLVATVLSGVLAVAFVAGHAFVRDWRRVGQLVAVCALATLPLVITLAIQLPLIESNTRTFWIPAGFTAARWTLQSQVELNLKINLALTLAGVAGMALIAFRNRRTLLRNPQLRLIGVLALGECAGIAILLGLHIWRPIVINRYLVAMVPPIMMALAIGASAVSDRLRDHWRLAFFAMLSLVSLRSIHDAWRQTLAAPTWYRTGSTIAEIVRDCPQTLVHADLYWNAPVIDLPPADNGPVMRMAYARTAQTLGFALEPERSRRMSGTCPTLFWVEHKGETEPAAEVARTLRQRGYAIRRGELRRIGRGWTFVAWPKTTAP